MITDENGVDILHECVINARWCWCEETVGWIKTVQVWAKVFLIFESSTFYTFTPFFIVIKLLSTPTRNRFSRFLNPTRYGIAIRRFSVGKRASAPAHANNFRGSRIRKYSRVIYKALVMSYQYSLIVQSIWLCVQSTASDRFSTQK